jgi:energy-coupling factor transporter ATP-binding protein EcfA2
MKQKGKLVILEGVEGVGKSTLIEALKSELSEEMKKQVVFLHEQGRQELPFAYREPAYWFHRLKLYTNVPFLLNSGLFLIAERSWFSGWCYEPRMYQPALMSVIYGGIGLAPEDVYVVVVQPEVCPADNDRVRLAYERYGELIEYGSPLGERVIGVRTLEEAKDFILRLLQQHMERGEEDGTEENTEAPISG